MSDTPYRYNHSLSPNKEKYLGELRDTSVNIASAISSASRYGSPHYFTRSKSNSSVSHSPKVVDCLDIRNINHEAIKNDMELKSEIIFTNNVKTVFFNIACFRYIQKTICIQFSSRG